MKTELIRIGNSRGIRIPKPIIEQCRLGETVELLVQQDRIVIFSPRTPRQGWGNAFRAAGSAERDKLLFASLPPNEFDSDEWKW
jgi:antitoxin MazE